MSSPCRDEGAALRWGIYMLLIALAVGNMSGRLLAVNSVNKSGLQEYLVRQDLQRVEQALQAKHLSDAQYQQQLSEARAQIEQTRQLERPFLSANDRSRWLGIRALVEEGTYEIDHVLDRTLWDTIDMVQHRGRDGQLHLYSSKPPLLYTLLAGEYWLIQRTTGMTLASHPYVVGRLMLVTINILPLAVMFWLIANMAELLGTTAWGKIFVVAAACLGTLLVPFATVLNNHTVAAVSATIALSATLKIWQEGEHRWRDYFLAGLGAAFTAANELPALALLVLVAGVLWSCDRRAWLQGFLPAALLVVVAFFATNYAAHDCLTPPYMHRSATDPAENWYHYRYTVDGVTRDSYWQNRQGIDQGEPSRAQYALHALVGHHGIFSLTPIWCLSVLGVLLWWRSGDRQLRWLALGILGLTLVVLVFYLGLRPQEDRNYGGMTSGLRWLLWMSPLWLVAMLPAADWCARTRLRQGVAAVLLALSAFSASYPTWNPWTHPWLYRLLESLAG